MRDSMSGFEINWSSPMGNAKLFNHPLYIKYNNQTFGNLDRIQVQESLAGVMATAGSDAICAYLSWLIRTLNLLEG
ncbi:hypothetical protein OAP41_00215 [Candidatus Poseidoniaceae archaeon]|nr:hypothetical protein [Candidatus Poseidoniaceae archaeon]